MHLRDGEKRQIEAVYAAKKAGLASADPLSVLELFVKFPSDLLSTMMAMMQEGTDVSSWLELSSQLASSKDEEGAETPRGILTLYHQFLECPGGIQAAVVSALTQPTVVNSGAWRDTFLQKREATLNMKIAVLHAANVVGAGEKLHPGSAKPWAPAPHIVEERNGSGAGADRGLSKNIVKLERIGKTPCVANQNGEVNQNGENFSADALQARIVTPTNTVPVSSPSQKRCSDTPSLLSGILKAPEFNTPKPTPPTVQKPKPTQPPVQNHKAGDAHAQLVKEFHVIVKAGSNSMSREQFYQHLVSKFSGQGGDLDEEILGEMVGEVFCGKDAITECDFVEFGLQLQEDAGESAEPIHMDADARGAHQALGEPPAMLTIVGKVIKKYEVKAANQTPKYYLIMESSPGVADVYVPRNIFVGWDLQQWHNIRNGHVIEVRAEPFQRGQNKWKAVSFVCQHKKRDRQLDTTLRIGVQVAGHPAAVPTPSPIAGMQAACLPAQPATPPTREGACGESSVKTRASSAALSKVDPQPVATSLKNKPCSEPVGTEGHKSSPVPQKTEPPKKVAGSKRSSESVLYSMLSKKARASGPAPSLRKRGASSVTGGSSRPVQAASNAGGLSVGAVSSRGRRKGAHEETDVLHARVVIDRTSGTDVQRSVIEKVALARGAKESSCNDSTDSLHPVAKKPPGKGYACKGCGQEGGVDGAHWADDCPKGGRSRRRSKMPVCTFWVEGKCHQGKDCRFSHDCEQTGAGKTICRFFLRGECKSGSSCIFSHDLKILPCKFFHVGGGCSKKDSCLFSHAPLTDEQRQWVEREWEINSKEAKERLAKAMEAEREVQKRVSNGEEVHVELTSAELGWDEDDAWCRIPVQSAANLFMSAAESTAEGAAGGGLQTTANAPQNAGGGIEGAADEGMSNYFTTAAATVFTSSDA